MFFSVRKNMRASLKSKCDFDSWSDFMFEYDFCYDDILSSSVVIKDGIFFDDERFSFESYWENGFNHYERLFYSTGNGEKAPFSGILYELYPNGRISGYSFYKDGYQEGQNVDYYDNGVLSKYSNFNRLNSNVLIIKWFRNGTISEVMELTDHGRRKKYVVYDENRNIIKQGEI